MEDKRGTDAMRRSWDLVGGHWWHAAFTLLVAALITERLDLDTLKANLQASTA